MAVKSSAALEAVGDDAKAVTAAVKYPTTSTANYKQSNDNCNNATGTNAAIVRVTAGPWRWVGRGVGKRRNGSWAVLSVHACNARRGTNSTVKHNSLKQERAVDTSMLTWNLVALVLHRLAALIHGGLVLVVPLAQARWVIGESRVNIAAAGKASKIVGEERVRV